VSFRFFYPDVPPTPLPPGHRFPNSKYALLHEKIARDQTLGAGQLIPSPIATRADILTVHDAPYVASIFDGTIDDTSVRRIGLPWSEALVTRSLTTVGGSLAAAREALVTGISGQLAGGTHHAHRAFGSGFCVFNDLAIATTILLAEGAVQRVAIVDLDVHQGDGTAAILQSEPRAFTLSVQGEKNFPFRRMTSSLDVELPDRTQDRAYLAAVSDALEPVIAFRPDLVLYLSGADPLAEDRLGRLSLSHEGLMERDRFVFETFRRRGVPVSIAIGGGYGEPISATVEGYANTFSAAREVYGF
jgi:acetoin utilization deacetylase AcuC-like enzyme